MARLHEDREAIKQTKKQREHQRLRYEDVNEAIKANLQHVQGRRLLWWLLDIGHAIGENPFATNALTMSFKCGENNVGLQVLDRIMEVDPDGFIKMMKEVRDERNTLQRNADAGNSDGDAG